MGLFDTEEEKKVYNVEYKKMKEAGYAFHPFATWKDVTLGMVLLLVLSALAATKGVHMDPPADPTSQYLPRPEWYFMFLFQLLKYFPGWTAIFAVAIIPGAVAGALALLPFYDRNPYRSPKRRPLAVAAMSLGMASIIGLTVLAYYEDYLHAKAHPEAATPVAASHGAAADPGEKTYQASCAMCHGASGTQIPNVALFSKDFLSKRDVVAVITNGKGGMPKFKGQLADDEIKAVANFLQKSAK